MEGVGAEGRNDPSLVCTYEKNKKKRYLYTDVHCSTIHNSLAF
jgi:hypothetical protein